MQGQSDEEVKERLAKALRVRGGAVPNLVPPTIDDVGSKTC